VVVEHAHIDAAAASILDGEQDKKTVAKPSPKASDVIGDVVQDDSEMHRADFEANDANLEADQKEAELPEFNWKTLNF